MSNRHRLRASARLLLPVGENQLRLRTAGNGPGRASRVRVLVQATKQLLRPTAH
jgi:hypothetical protein